MEVRARRSGEGAADRADPDAREPVVAQIAAAVQGPGGAGTAVMYLDGQVVNPEVRGTSANSTLFANFDPALDPGRRTVVLFASDDREASATAWAFTVEKKKEAGRRAASVHRLPGELEALEGQHEHENREPPGGYGEQTHDRTLGAAC